MIYIIDMRKNITKNNKRLIFSELFQFCYMGRFKIEIIPYGSNDYKIKCIGFKILQDEKTNELFVFGDKPTYKTELFCKNEYYAITLWSLIIKTILDTFKDDDFISECANIEKNYNTYLPNIKEFL